MAILLKRTFDEAVAILEKHCDELMQNQNWHSIAVTEDPNCADSHILEVWVYDFEEAKTQFSDPLNRLFKDSNVYDGKITCLLSPGRRKDPMKADGIDSEEIWTHINKIPTTKKSRTIRVNPNCDKEIRKMGHMLRNSKKPGSGTIGCFVESQQGDIYAVTAYHVVKPENNSDDGLGDVIISPAIKGKELGILSWGELDDYSDICLIKVTNTAFLEKGSICCINLAKDIGPPPQKGDEVRICSSVDFVEIKCATVKHTDAATRIEKGSPDIAKRRIITTDLGSPGDSGAIVINENDQAVGLFTKDAGINYSQFMPLEILKGPLKMHDGSTFRFKEFY